MPFYLKRGVLFLLILSPLILLSQTVKILTNQVGYEDNLPKRAVIAADSKVPVESFRLINTDNDRIVFTGKPVFSGPVDKWKNWIFWTIDFSDYIIDGNYKLEMVLPGRTVVSHSFRIGKNVLEQSTISDVIYYFKGQRCSGLLDKADHRLSLEGRTGGSIDAHGGWYDATGDYGKHLSHLSFSTWFNPQQIPFTAWSLLKTYGLLVGRPGTDFRQYNRRLLDEAMYGADYLVRVQVPGGSFYRSVSAPGPWRRE